MEGEREENGSWWGGRVGRGKERRGRRRRERTCERSPSIFVGEEVEEGGGIPLKAGRRGGGRREEEGKGEEGGGAAGNPIASSPFRMSFSSTSIFASFSTSFSISFSISPILSLEEGSRRGAVSSRRR